MRDWIHSPDRVIGLFPDWYAPLQADWPKQTALVGFPLYDASKEAPLSDGLLRFLDDGPPPVVFSSGTGMQHAARYFSTAVEICRTSGRRGVLLSSFAENFKATLPPFVRSEPYAPFSQLLPRSAAFFHHGGIGSVALALAAGTPQVAVPAAYDQPDNGARIERLGVGVSIAPRKFNVSRGVAALDRVLSASYARACADVKLRFVNARTLERTADLVERAFAERSA
jgi:UDP:flavonoid glycosyltransferase YjiC (YdhE family)